MSDASKLIPRKRAKQILEEASRVDGNRSGLDAYISKFQGPAEEADFLTKQVVPYLNAHRTWGLNDSDIDEILDFIYTPRAA